MTKQIQGSSEPTWRENKKIITGRDHPEMALRNKERRRRCDLLESFVSDVAAIVI
jgi:metallophosphoesterase superfamily enzyme